MPARAGPRWRRVLLPLLLTTACATAPAGGDGSGVGAATPADSPAVARAYAHLESERDRLGLADPRRQLRLRAEHRDALGATHLRFDQVVDGVPVWGGEIGVHIDRDGNVYRITGRATPGIEGLGTTPAIGPEAARAAATRSGGRAEEAVLAVLPESGAGRLVYRVTVFQGLMRRFVFVDAATAEVVREVSGTPTEGGPS